jgi:hypothetical protein
MQIPKMLGSNKVLPVLVAVGLIGAGAVVKEVVSSDHAEVAEVELNPTLDLNDVYVFPGSTDDRIVLVMNVASPTNALGRNVNGFNPNALYQFNIDNNGDAQADLVLQFTFDEMRDGTQRVTVLGPADPGRGMTGKRSRLVAGPRSAANPFNQTFTTANGMQVFTGPRSDPFYIDFEQFVRIIPDRRPVTFLQDVVDRPASAFCGDSEPFDTSCEPTNLFEGANTLSIVVEMPESMLNPGTGTDAALGIWATISREEGRR